MAGIPGVILVRRLKLNLRHMGKGCDQFEEEEDSLLVWLPVVERSLLRVDVNCIDFGSVLQNAIWPISIIVNLFLDTIMVL